MFNNPASRRGSAELLERYGVDLDLEGDEELALVESPSRPLSFELRGFLPDAHQPPRSVLELREVWQPTESGVLERRDYAYELIDHERDYRRAFHLHDRDWFADNFTWSSTSTVSSRSERRRATMSWVIPSGTAFELSRC